MVARVSVTQVILWVVGAPGAGKTTACRGLMGEVNYIVPTPKWTVAGSGTIAAAGHYIGAAFDGADTVPYNGAEAALKFWRSTLAEQVRVTLLDGDRFSNSSTRNWFKENAAWSLQLCVLIAPSEATCAKQRAQRGTSQNPIWVKGRTTKALRFWEAFDPSCRLELSEADPPDVAKSIVRWIESKVNGFNL